MGLLIVGSAVVVLALFAHSTATWCKRHGHDWGREFDRTRARRAFRCVRCGWWAK